MMSLAEAMEDLEVISCSETSMCSTPDSEPTSDSKEPKIPGDVDSWCELPQLIELRTKLRTEMNNTETQALTLEQDICENRVSNEKTLCGSCGLVREPRQRKITVLRLMHQAMMKRKPKHLLCTAGIITHLETMILEGFLDFGSSNKVTRCRHCRQEIDQATMRSNLVSEFIDILEEQRNKCTNKENCSMTEACCACLDFMLSQLKNPELLKAQNGKKNDPNHAKGITHHSIVPSKPKDETPQNCDQDKNSDGTPEPKDGTPRNHEQDDMNIDSEPKNESPPIADQTVTYHSTIANNISVPIPNQDLAQHFNVASEPKNVTTPVTDQDDAQHSDVTSEPKDDTPQIVDQDSTNHSNVTTESNNKSVSILNQDNTQHDDVATEPNDASSPIFNQENAKHSTVDTLNQDVTNDLAEAKKIQDCEQHPHVDAATILFKNVFTKQLQSLTAELDKRYAEQQENQKDMLTEITLLKEKLQECVKTEVMYPELQNYHKEIAAIVLQVKENQKKFVTTGNMHSELKIVEDKWHEKLKCKMNLLKWDRAEKENVKSELQKHKKRHNELIIEINGLKVQLNTCVRTEEMQAKLDLKHTNIQNNVMAQVNAYFKNHAKDCVTTKTLQLESSKHEKTLREHLDKLNSVQNQLKRLQVDQSALSYDRFDQIRKIRDLQALVDSLKTSLASGGENAGRHNYPRH